jgi:hypothetical protein
MRVDKAYTDDAMEEDLSAYVCSEVYKLIVAEKSTVADVEPVDGITLGCDPELILIDKNGTVIPASAYLHKNTPVGYDGLLLEFRPMPSVSEYDVTRNLYDLMRQMRYSVPKEFRAISVSAFHGDAQITPKYKQYVRVTTGFHLHYGLPRAFLGYSQRFLADQIVKVLDYYVGIPATLPEGSSDSYRRTAPYMDYGKPGTYRLDNRTLEYRVPGGILLRHPAWACGLMGLGAAVIEDVAARLKYHSYDYTQMANVGNEQAIRLLYPNLPPVSDIFGTICNPTTDRAKMYMDNIVKDVRSMVGYSKREASINNFFNALEADFPVDTEVNWETCYGKRQSR